MLVVRRLEGGDRTRSPGVLQGGGFVPAGCRNQVNDCKYRSGK